MVGGCPSLCSVAMTLKPSTCPSGFPGRGDVYERELSSAFSRFQKLLQGAAPPYLLVTHPHRTFSRRRESILLSCWAGLPAMPPSCNLTSDNPSLQLPCLPPCPFVYDQEGRVAVKPQIATKRLRSSASTQRVGRNGAQRSFFPQRKIKDRCTIN